MIANDTKHTGYMKKRSEPRALKSSRSVGARVLAGARATGDPLAIAHNVSSKAHIKVAGMPMITRVLNALSESQYAGRVSVVGLQDQDRFQTDELSPDIHHIAGADGPAASVRGALAQSEQAPPILVTTCDHALLTPAMIDAFLDKSLQSGADLTVALAPQAVIEDTYPDVQRTYLRFGDGAYSSCNLFCLNTEAAKEVVQFWQSAEQDRKRPWRIAWRFGVVRALRILIGRPDLDRVFAIISERLEVTIRPVILPFADAAVDIDKPDDLALVERVLAERAK